MGDSTKIERLENALLRFVEKVVDEPASDKELEILPLVAHQLKEILLET